MCENISHIPGETIPINIRFDRIVSFMIGFLLLFVGPRNNTFLVHITGSYRLNFFEFIMIPTVLIGLTVYGARIKKYEQPLFFSLFFLAVVSVISLLGSGSNAMIQWASVIRYFVFTVAVIYILANIFAENKNRRIFIYGLIAGVAIETIAGLCVFIISRSTERGYFINHGNWMPQTFLVVACVLAVMCRRKKILLGLSILVLLSGMLATLSRSILLVIIFGFLYMLVYSRFVLKRMSRTLFLLILILAIILSVGAMFPWTSKHFSTRIEDAVSLNDSSVSERLFLAEMCVKAFLDHPVIGVGSGSFRGQYEIFKQYSNNALVDFFYGGTPHSRILGILAEMGIMGLLAYLFWAITLSVICIRILWLTKSNAAGNILIIAASLTIMLFLVTDVINEVSFLPYMTVLVGFVLGWLREQSNMRIMA